MNRRLLCCIVSAMLTTGCSPGAQLVVVNQSNVPLADVVASGSGFSAPLGTIPPREERRLRVHPRGESGLTLRFTADGKSVASGPDGYFEDYGGYIVTATVTPALGVTLKSELRH